MDAIPSLVWSILIGLAFLLLVFGVIELLSWASSIRDQVCPDDEPND